KNSVEIVDGEKECRYRGPDGLKCAVGHIIPDELYTPDLEGKLFARDGQPIECFNEIAAKLELTRDNVLLLAALQDIHDFSEPHEWEQRFANLAKSWNLTL